MTKKKCWMKIGSEFLDVWDEIMSSVNQFSSVNWLLSISRENLKPVLVQLTQITMDIYDELSFYSIYILFKKPELYP